MKIVVTGLRGFPNIQGGIETHCEELYPRLAAKEGCQITVIRRTPFIKEDPLLTSYRGVQFQEIDAPQKSGLEAAIHTLRSVWFAYKKKADIIHIHAIGPSICVPIAKLLGLKVVVTHHGPDYDRAKWGFIAKTILKLGELFAAKGSDELIVISEVIRKSIEEKYGRKNSHLIFNGVNQPKLATSSSYIESLGLVSKRYILAVGRFVEEKNFDKLILAFSMIKEKRGVQLVLAGDADHPTPYSNQLKALAKQHHVILTGMIKGAALQELFTHAALFVLPSSHEGLPITLLEAMSYGLDLLTSDIPANLAVGLPASNYFHLDEKMIEQLSEAIKQKLHEENGSCRYDLTPYNWDHIADQTFAVYQKAAKK